MSEKQKGCGEYFTRGAYTSTCGETTRNGKIELCPECQKKQNQSPQEQIGVQNRTSEIKEDTGVSEGVHSQDRESLQVAPADTHPDTSDNSTLEDEIKLTLRYLETFYQSNRNHAVVEIVKELNEKIRQYLSEFFMKVEGELKLRIYNYDSYKEVMKIIDKLAKEEFGGLVE